MIKKKLVYLDFIEPSYTKKQKIISQNSNLSQIDENKAHEYCEQLTCKYITILCSEYPNEFKMLPRPPWVIYYQGDINLLKTKSVGVIGSRKYTEYGKLATQKIISKMKEIVIVSGMAYGIDQIAHDSALKNNLKTVAIIGSGLNNIYPKNDFLIHQITKHGLIISEYPPLSKAKPWHFPMRNRLIASLSKKLLVIEATVKSGSLITVEIALEQNKEIYALPGNVFSLQSKGTNLLIEEGANVLTLDSEF